MDVFKVLCDMCRKKLVEYIGVFLEFYGKIGDMGVSRNFNIDFF